MSGWWTSTLEYWQAGGMLLIPLALVHLAIWAYFLRARSYFIRELQAGASLAACLADLPVDLPAARVTETLSAQPGGMSALLAEALRDIQNGSRPAETFSRQEDRAHRWWRRDLLVLGALTSVAPLLGLLGTVSGMIFTFDAVAATVGDTASRVAEGVSTALITTQFGLIIALPGLFGLARLQRLIQAVEVRLAECRSLIVVSLGGWRAGGAS